jgi:hypothetical protein
VKPDVMFGSETWAVTEMDMKRLDTGRGKYQEGKGTLSSVTARSVENRN